MGSIARTMRIAAELAPRLPLSKKKSGYADERAASEAEDLPFGQVEHDL